VIPTKCQIYGTLVSIQVCTANVSWSAMI